MREDEKTEASDNSESVVAEITPPRRRFYWLDWILFGLLINMATAYIWCSTYFERSIPRIVRHVESAGYKDVEITHSAYLLMWLRGCGYYDIKVYAVATHVADGQRVEISLCFPTREMSP